MAKKTGKDLFTGDVPKMPEGYYSGDRLNPSLKMFVEAHAKERPYDFEHDNYALKPNVGSILTTKRTPIYGLHSYDSKKPPDALKKYIEHFTQPGDLVLDPFIGSGMTAIASLQAKRKCIAIDNSPLATFITANYCAPVDSSYLSDSAENILKIADQDASDLYKTICGRCGKEATIYFTVYSQTYECRRCMSIVTLYDALQAHSQESAEDFKAHCPKCAQRNIREPISNRQERKGYVPVLIEYICSCSENERIPRRYDDSDKRERELFKKIDLTRMEAIDKSKIKHWYPTNQMMWVNEQKGPWGLLWRPYHGEIRRVDQFFTKRNLIALSTLLWAIEQEKDMRCREALRFLFSAFVLSQSKLQRYHPGSTFPNMIAPGLLYVAPMIKEYNVFHWYAGKVRSAIKGFDGLSGLDPHSLVISTQSATALDNIPSNSVDYILTDPPYSGKIQYGELNFIQESWLRFNLDWRESEIIVNPVRNKTELEWAGLMKQAFSHCFRVLKPGRWLSLCYHDSSEGTWSIVQDMLAEIGFVSETTKEAVYIDAKQKSLKQITADKVTKRDLVINFYKPKLDELPGVLITADEPKKTFNEKVLEVIRECLESHPGTTKDRIYDEVVSRMVRAGRMEAHDFEGLLRQVAEEVKEPVKKTLYENEDPNIFGTHEISRWYLKETEFAETDAAESAKEDAAAEKVEKFIEKKLKEQPWLEGVHYSDIFEHYIYSVKDKPRRPLAEWLLDYFFKPINSSCKSPQRAKSMIILRKS